MSGVWVFGFNKAFAGAVASGAKRQTIRAERNDGRRPVVGQVARCYTGLRTAGCRHLLDAPIVRVADVVIGHRYIEVDGVALSESVWPAFARADGFADVDALFKFFEVGHGGGFFRGYLAMW
ncbi:hypothetical protein [Methylomonas sp. CM2]|uniref:hypothetical protein n=1 Tax=Methylomonas sp. CM2 TaxID=3417647 RepID=UPI003CF3F9A2